MCSQIVFGQRDDVRLRGPVVPSGTSSHEVHVVREECSHGGLVLLAEGFLLDDDDLRQQGLQLWLTTYESHQCEI